MTRKKLIAANWKMYKTPEQTTAFFAEFLPMVAGHSRDEIVICPPFLDLHAAVEVARAGAGAQLEHRLIRRAARLANDACAQRGRGGHHQTICIGFANQRRKNIPGLATDDG